VTPKTNDCNQLRPGGFACDQDGDVQDNIDPAARPTRRTFSTEEKLALLAAYEACDPGKKGEFARREGGRTPKTKPLTLRVVAGS